MAFFALGVFFLIAGVCDGAFFALAPKDFFAEQPINLAVTVHKSSGMVKVEASLKQSRPRYKLISTETILMDQGESQMITLQVPSDILVKGSYKVNVKCSGGLIHDEDIAINFNPNSTAVLVQTDKKIYKPGQLVRIRVITVDGDLKPIFTPVRLLILNPLNNKIERMTNLTSRSGVIQTEFQISKYPVLGDWKIQVESDTGLTYMHVFKVDEYVLPKFSVEIKTEPGYVIKGSSRAFRSPKVEVKAIYTYGEGVQGTCTLAVRLKDISVKETYTAELDGAGSVTFIDIDWDVLIRRIRQFPEKIILEASVKDETGREESAEGEITAFDSHVKVQILDSSTLVVRDGIPAELKVQVSDLMGSVVPGAEIEAKLDLPNISPIVFKETLAEGQTEVTFKYTPIKLDGTIHGAVGTAVVRVLNYPGVEAMRDIYVYLTQSKNRGIQLDLDPSNSLDPNTIRYGYQFSKQQEDTWTISYTVVNKGNIVKTGLPDGDFITFQAEPSMCPESTIVVYMVVGHGNNTEIVMDVVQVTPLMCFEKQTAVNFDYTEVRVGTEVDMHVQVEKKDESTAVAGTYDVFYLGLDKSIILLQGKNEVGLDEVKTSIRELQNPELRRLAFRSEENIHDDTLFRTSAKDIIMDTGLVAITDKVVVKEPFQEEEQFFPEMGIMFKNPVMGHAAADRVPSFEDEEFSMDDGGRAPQKQPAVTTKTVRKNFPDTWLWGHGVTDANGKLIKRVELPDTITTWVVSAFAVNDQGLAVSKKPFEIKGFQPFFISLNLPYSIKRGEIFALRATVFNYRNQELKVLVSLKENSDQFSVVGHSAIDGWFRKDLTLQPYLAYSVEFMISATTIGTIDLEAKAEDNTDGQSDKVLKKLIVKPEGIERSNAMSRAMVSETGSPVTERFVIDWPEDIIVPDSKRVEVKVTGDVLGQAINNLDNLVVQPSGCGEQNMITTVPNIMGLRYIQKTDQKNMQELEIKLKKNAKHGYQRELSYRHRDGSFSAWGEGNNRQTSTGSKGSTWLTAFVMKSFSLARNYIDVDSEVLQQGIQFLRDVQNSNGEFREFGKVIHQEITSGTTAGPGLTVYCLISLLETKEALGMDRFGMSQSVAQALSFIKKQMNLSAVPMERRGFLAAMTAYGLSLVPNPDTETIELRDRLMAAAVEIESPWLVYEGDFKKFSSSSHNILEVGAYLLLTYIRTNRLMEASPIMKWLQSQQNSRGGYSHTQNTVMVLQALAKYGEVFKGSPAPSYVTIGDPSSQNFTEFDLSGEKSTLLQTYYLPSATDVVEVTLRGGVDAMAIVKVVYVFYTDPGTVRTIDAPSFTISSTSRRMSPNTHTVKTCVNSLSGLTDPGMTVVTMTLPSGEQTMDDMATLMEQNPSVSRVEVEDDMIHFYNSEAPKDEQCYTANIERSIDFELQLPGSAVVYSYYSPEFKEEVSIDLNTACTDNCDVDGADTLHIASLVLTVIICTLISLLLCV